MPNKVLVTGGAGYIGSHIVRQLNEAGEDVIVLDNLSTGYADAVPTHQLIVGDVSDTALVSKVLCEHGITAVMHLAANTVVPESIENPVKYYENNVTNTLRLLTCCQQHNIKNFIYSSSASVYGKQDIEEMAEEQTCFPMSPYGRSKLIGEWLTQDIAQACALRFVTLRYFNVAGADALARMGQRSDASLLIRSAVQAALGLRENIRIYGTDYPTVDGTGIRDYIHVDDIASAHLAALAYLRQNGSSVTLNCGYGNGYSVKQVLEAVQKVTGITLKIIASERRLGDPVKIIANAAKIKQTLNWQPRFNNLDSIIKTAWQWEQKLQQLQS